MRALKNNPITKQKNLINALITLITVVFGIIQVQSLLVGADNMK